MQNFRKISISRSLENCVNERTDERTNEQTDERTDTGYF